MALDNLLAPQGDPKRNPLDDVFSKNRMLFNLLAQSGYSTVPGSPLGAIGRAALLTQEQDREDRKLDLSSQLMRTRFGGNTTPAGQREFEALVQAAREDNPNKTERDAARVSLGLDPRAGISADERIALDPSLTSNVAGSKAAITGAVEEAKAGVQRESEVTATNQDRAQTLGVWEAARQPLLDALDGTITGPVPGMGMLLAQLLLAIVLTLVLSWLLRPFLGWFGMIPALAAAYGLLSWFRKLDGKLYAYYLMHDYAYSAKLKGKTPDELRQRLRSFTALIREADRKSVV